MLRFIRSYFCICLALLAIPGISLAQVGATVHCVGTAQELAAAIAQTNASSDPFTFINVGVGTYNESADEFALNPRSANRTVNLSGGWTYPGCASKAYGAGAGTVIQGNATHPALRLDMGVVNGNNTLNITDLTLRNPLMSGLGVPACLYSNVLYGTSMNVRRVRLEQCVHSNGSAATMGNTGGLLSVDNFVAIDNSTTNAPVIVSSNSGATTRLSQFTITGNQVPAGALSSGLFLGSFDAGTLTYFANSVVWGGIAPAGKPDITVSGGSANLALSNVHREIIQGAASEVGATSGNPGFVSPTNPRLRSNSILIDKGIAAPAGGTGSFDNDGATRVQGAAVDVGAYERDPDRLFADNFEQGGN